MSAHLARAQLHLAQSRPADAEREALLALAAQPDDPAALAILALSRTEQGKGEAALAAARTAIGLAPDDAYLHYVHAITLHHLARDSEARAAAQESLRLDPENANNFSLLASIELAHRDWPAALAAAEQALALDPEHIGAGNLRAMALVRLGRKDEAVAAVDFTLHRAPENAFSHANQGWNCLHKNDPRSAQEYFREALRLDPTLEYARDGMLEALKARNPIYRGMLVYFLWIGLLSAQFQWVFIIGIFFGGRVIGNLAETHPKLGWFLWPLLILFYVFVYLSWTAVPMFNLLLRLNRFGRHVLNRDQRIASNWFGTFFLGALTALAWWQIRDSDIALLATLFLAVLSLCIAATFNRTGRPRRILGASTGVLAATAVLAFTLLLLGRPIGMTVVTGFIYGFIGFQLLANFVRIK